MFARWMLWMFRVLVVVPVVAISVVALGSCVANVFHAAAVDNYDGPIQDHTGAVTSSETGLSAAWVSNGTAFAVSMTGSAGCPPVATGFMVVGDNAVDVTVQRPPAGGECGNDLGPHTTVLAVTPDVIPTKMLRINVEGDSVRLPALNTSSD